MLNELNNQAAQLTICDGVKYRSLEMFALVDGNPAAEPGYVTLEEAIASGVARVTEVSASGFVPELLFHNEGSLPVLLLDGEELIGAKQNRVLNLTILAPARSKIVIPVSCVEAGRWRMASEEFRASPQMMYSRLRAEKVEQVTYCLRTEMGRMSDQAAVWEDLAAKAERLDAASPTGAMSEVFARNKIRVEEFERAFSLAPGQVGVAYRIGGRQWGVDLFDHARTMERYWKKLLRSYALDAIDEEQEAEKPAEPEEVRRLFERVAAGTAFCEQSPGLGKDVRMTAEGLSGAGLWVEGRYVHFCAFSRNGGNGGRLKTRMSMPSRRRVF
jgi:hypothetical protein